MDIHPIKTEADYQAALKEVDSLFDATPNTLRGDQLEVLTMLIEAYEEQRFSIPAPDPIEALNYFMESRGLTRKDLAPYIGNRERVSEILSRRRSLTLVMIRRLHDGLGIPAEVLIKPYRTQKAKARKVPAPNARIRQARASQLH